MLSGCGPKDPFPPGNHYSSSNINIPFIPPRSELCASTSIQMVSLYWQSTTSYLPKLSLQDLDERTLIPEKKGTFQIELVSAARANGLIAYPLEPTFDSLFSELLVHHPVIVLVNRSFSWYPLWHYAPVTGYNGDKRTIALHFSDRPNEALSIETFAALWKRSDNWGVILLPPGELPVSISSKTFLRSAYELEKIGMIKEAITAYKSALFRWPEDLDILFALGTAYHHSNQLMEAERSYRQLLSIYPSSPLALNNLAVLLCHTGRSNEALLMIKKAVTDDITIQNILKTTRDEIEMGCNVKSEK